MSGVAVGVLLRISFRGANAVQPGCQPACRDAGNAFHELTATAGFLLFQQRQTRGVIAAGFKHDAVDLWVSGRAAALFMLRVPITRGDTVDEASKIRPCTRCSEQVMMDDLAGNCTGFARRGAPRGRYPSVRAADVPAAAVAHVEHGGGILSVYTSGGMEVARIRAQRGLRRLVVWRSHVELIGPTVWLSAPMPNSCSQRRRWCAGSNSR